MSRRVRKTKSRSKEFEELAARLEAALAPTGARVKTPDRIRDKLTGQFREVDASIRYSVGSSDLLITIECRDRVRTQDVTWIEQLATKRTHIGADRTLAVSSSPFTDAALRAARFHGISTRLISEVTAEDIRSASNTIEVTVDTLDLALKRMQLHYVDSLPQSPQLDPAALQAWSVDCWHAPIFRIGTPERSASIDDLVKVAAKPTLAKSQPQAAVNIPPLSAAALGTDPLSLHLKDVAADGVPVTKDFLLTFDEGEAVFALTDLGLKQLRAVSITLTVTRSRRAIPPSYVGQYATEDKLITRFAEHKVEWKPGETWSVLSYPTPGGSKEGAA